MKQNEDRKNGDSDNEGETQDTKIMGDICRRHQCYRCGKPCFIDPGPPPTHKPFTMAQLSVWTSLVVC